MSVGRMMAESGAVNPNLQFKITAFMSGDLVASLAVVSNFLIQLFLKPSSLFPSQPGCMARYAIQTNQL